MPINIAQKVMEQIVRNGRVERGRIGVALQDLEAPANGNLEGARVAEVAPGSPAERAGLHKGDVIVKANDVPIRSATQMRNLIGLTPVGQKVRLTYERNRVTGNTTVEVERVTEQENRSRSPG